VVGVRRAGNEAHPCTRPSSSIRRLGDEDGRRGRAADPALARGRPRTCDPSTSCRRSLPASLADDASKGRAAIARACGRAGDARPYLVLRLHPVSLQHFLFPARGGGCGTGPE